MQCCSYPPSSPVRSCCVKMYQSMIVHRLPDWEKDTIMTKEPPLSTYGIGKYPKNKEKIGSKCSKLTKLKEYVRIGVDKSQHGPPLQCTQIGVLTGSKVPWDSQFRKEGACNSYEYFLPDSSGSKFPSVSILRSREPRADKRKLQGGALELAYSLKSWWLFFSSSSPEFTHQKTVFTEGREPSTTSILLKAAPYPAASIFLPWIKPIKNINRKMGAHTLPKRSYLAEGHTANLQTLRVMGQGRSICLYTPASAYIQPFTHAILEQTSHLPRLYICHSKGLPVLGITIVCTAKEIQLGGYISPISVLWIWTCRQSKHKCKHYVILKWCC